MASNGEVESYVPNVLWSQCQNTISLKILVSDVKNPKINLTQKSITFQGEGNGAKGWNLYKFSLEFHNHIDKEACVYKLSPSYVDLKLTKQGKQEFWPRLIPEKAKKPHFLKLDFDRWQSESDVEEEKLRREKDDAVAKLKKELDMGDFVQKFYLTLYNVSQFILFFIIVLVCTVGRLKRGPEFYSDTYETIGGYVMFAVGLSYLEAIHPILGIVRTSWQLPCLQVTGRFIVLICIWLCEAQGLPRCAVWDLYMAWGIAELIRYPFYLAQLFGKDIKPLTWLRYHAWMILYPFGGLTEFTIYMSVAWYFEEKNMYQLVLPNGLNFSVSLSTMLRIVGVILLGCLTSLMRHMWKMRQRKYGHRRKFKPA